MSYAGYVRVIDANENILDVVEANLDVIDRPGHQWGGTLMVSTGGALEGKTMNVDLSVPNEFRAPALLMPGPTVGNSSEMTVLGNGPVPFDS